MLPRFADIFQQGNRWLNWLEKQPEGSVRPMVIESVTKIMACGTTPFWGVFLIFQGFKFLSFQSQRTYAIPPLGGG